MHGCRFLRLDVALALFFCFFSKRHQTKAPEKIAQEKSETQEESV